MVNASTPENKSVVLGLGFKVSGLGSTWTATRDGERLNLEQGLEISSYSHYKGP